MKIKVPQLLWHGITEMELARRKKEVVILFDDISRPTPVYEIIPYVLRELEKAGISDHQIRLISALGAHGANTALDFKKKLWEEILDRFPFQNRMRRQLPLSLEFLSPCLPG